MRIVSPDDLAIRARSFDLLPHLDTERLARILEIHERLPSTNDRATDLAREGAVHGVTVVALEQTAGRGQRGRSWHSPPGSGLYVSFVIRPTLSPRLAPALTVLSGLAVRDAIQTLVRTKLEVKWPNDLLVGEGPRYGKKLAGILVEASTDSFKIDYAVIGVGVNLDRADRPDDLASRAISLEELGALERSPALVLGKIAGSLERRLDQAAVDGLAPIARDFTRHAFKRGEHVRITADGEHLEGTLTGIAEDGALLLDTPTGPRTLYRGELALSEPPSP
jgi:BirA family biotin operon repressor/biotin-[acetyl-CoA-carboxylase] ligase